MHETPTRSDTLATYRDLSILPMGIERSQVPKAANQNMTDVQLVAFYSERYADADGAPLLLTERAARLHGLCNLVHPGERYLDVGCADGEHMAVLRQRGCDGIGLDVSVSNILKGREKFPDMVFVHGFAEAIPFRSGSFDVAVLSDVIQQLRIPRLVLAECLRVARSGLAICTRIDGEVTEEDISPLTPDTLFELLSCFELDLQFSGYDGQPVELSGVTTDIPTYPWVLVRAEKTAGTDSAVAQVLGSARTAEHALSIKEVLSADEWALNTLHERDLTHRARFQLLSHLIEGQRVLEVGCGNGDLSVEIAALGFDVTGVDMSPLGVEQASELARERELADRAQFVRMDATRLSFPDSTFDTVLIPEVLEHVKASRAILEEAVRVVRSGGRVVVSVPDGLAVPWPGHIRVFFRDTLASELSQYAKTVQCHELPFRKWLICSFFVKKAADVAQGPRVDIIMPTYNGRASIREAIQSVVEQTYEDWTLQVVNDGGEDVRDVVEAFHDSRITYTCSEHKGKSHAMNVGIAASSGEFIGCLDDDDILYPLHLEMLVAAALEKGKDLVYADWYEVSLDEGNRETGREFEFRTDVTPSMLVWQNYINHKCVLHRRRLLQATGMYDENLDFWIDWDMIRRLAAAADLCHVWGVTSERRRYCERGVLKNRITSLLRTDPGRAQRSVARIFGKTGALGLSGEELAKSVTDGVRVVESLWAALGQSQAQVAEREWALQESTRELASMTGSTAWAAMRVLSKMRLRVAPRGSLREAMLKAGIRALQLWHREGLKVLVRAVIQEILGRGPRAVRAFALARYRSLLAFGHQAARKASELAGHNAARGWGRRNGRW